MPPSVLHSTDMWMNPCVAISEAAQASATIFRKMCKVRGGNMGLLFLIGKTNSIWTDTESQKQQSGFYLDDTAGVYKSKTPI